MTTIQMTHLNDHGPWYENQQISYQDIVKDMKTLFNIENDNTLEYTINQAFLEISDKSKVPISKEKTGVSPMGYYTFIRQDLITIMTRLQLHGN